MIRKTFNTVEEATPYFDNIEKDGGIAFIGRLGGKFRVYARTKTELDETKHFRESIGGSLKDAKRSLRNYAFTAKNAVDEALELQRFLRTNGDNYDYETILEVARILEKSNDLKTARDVIAFFDDPFKHKDMITQDIKDTLEQYDYEGIEETAKE